MVKFFKEYLEKFVEEFQEEFLRASLELLENF